MLLTDDVVLLRAIARDDLEVMRGWINSPQTSRFLSPSWPVSAEGQAGWLDRLQKRSDAVKLIVEAVEEAQPVGMFSCMHMDPVNRSVEVGISIGSTAHLGRGFASRALSLGLHALFEQFNFRRVWAQILEPNEPSIRLFRAKGFVLEGTQREAQFWEGRFVGVHTFGLLREEHRSRNVES